MTEYKKGDKVVYFRRHGRASRSAQKFNAEVLEVGRRLKILLEDGTTKIVERENVEKAKK